MDVGKISFLNKVKHLEQQVSKLLQYSLEAIVAVDDRFKVVLFNNGAEKLFDYKSKEILGSNLSLIMPEFRTNILNLYASDKLNKQLDAKSVSDRHTLHGMKRNGEEFILDASITKVYLSHGPVLTLFLSDITQRTSLEKEILSSKHRYEYLIKMSRDAIITLNGSFEIIIFNDGARKVFGYSEPEIIGRHVKYLLPEENREENFNYMVSACDIPNSSTKLEPPDDIFGLRKDGIQFHAEATITNIHFEDEVMYSIILRDVSSRKLMEKQMVQYLSELEKINTEKEKYFSLLAHDLRSPFGNLLGFIDYMQDNLGELKKEELQEILKSCAASAKNIYHLLESLLDWTRLQMNRISFKPAKVNPLQYIEEAVALYKEAIENKGISVNILVDTDVEVLADVDMFATIVRNLLSNAIKFSYEQGDIDITGGKENDYFAINFNDYGIGMEEDTLSKLFRTDKDMHTEGTKGESGFGLGLLLVKDFVELNNGSIHVKSKYKAGTNITIKLPLAKNTELSD